MNLLDMVLLKLLMLLYCLSDTKGQNGKPLSKYIRHYEGLSYDTDVLHSKHQRAKRALSHQDQFLHLDFHAHGSLFFFRIDPGLFYLRLHFSQSNTE